MLASALSIFAAAQLSATTISSGWEWSDRQSNEAAVHGDQGRLQPVIGYEGSIGEVTTVTDPDVCRTDDNCLKATESPISGTPALYLAWVTSLNPGDVVTASFWVKGGYSAKATIWGHFTNDDDDYNSGATDVGGTTYGGLGGGWDELSYSWTITTYNSGLVIEAKMYCYDDDDNTIYIDDLTVTVEPYSASSNALIASSPAYESSFSDRGVPLGIYTAGNDNLVVSTVEDGCRTYGGCFLAIEEPLAGTPEVYVAAVYNLSPHDYVYAHTWVKGGGGDTSGRLWASYFVGQDVSDYAGAHTGGGPPTKSGANNAWGLSEWKWEVPNPAPASGLNIQIRLYADDVTTASLLIDDLLVSTNSTTAYVVLSPVIAAPPPPPGTGEVLCDDSCYWSSDGYCDDGGPGHEFVVGSICELGTDCADCGPRVEGQHGGHFQTSFLNGGTPLRKAVVGAAALAAHKYRTRLAPQCLPACDVDEICHGTPPACITANYPITYGAECVSYLDTSDLPEHVLTSLHGSEVACNSDPLCGGVEDYKCDGVRLNPITGNGATGGANAYYRLCTTDGIVNSGVSDPSCVFVKPPPSPPPPPPENWEQQLSTSCTTFLPVSSTDAPITTLEAAQAECDASLNCGAIMDAGCDGVGLTRFAPEGDSYLLCQGHSTAPSASDCTYIKPNAVPPPPPMPHLPGAWAPVESMQCATILPRDTELDTLSDAQAACDSDPNCGGVGDLGCDGTTSAEADHFTLCYGTELVANTNQCVYLKPMPPPEPADPCIFNRAGWCAGGVDDCGVGYQPSAQACWDVCYTKYGTDLVSADIDDHNSDGDCYPDPNTGEFLCHCCCQDACPYCYGAGGETLIMAAGFGELDASCGVGNQALVCPGPPPPPAPYQGCYFPNAGWCVGNDDCSTGYQPSLQQCWDACYEIYREGLVSVDLDEFNIDGDCYTDPDTGEYMCHCCCQNACDYCNSAGGESLIIAFGFGELDSSCGTGDAPLVCGENGPVTAPSPPTCYFEGAGWCGNSIDDCSFQSTAQVCWDQCYAKYGADLVSADIDEYNTDGVCYTDANTGEDLCPCCCQTSCDVCYGAGGESMIVRDGVALPDSCGTGSAQLVCGEASPSPPPASVQGEASPPPPGDYNTCYFPRAGWCYGNDDCSTGYQPSAQACWDVCYSKYGDSLVSIDIDDFNTDSDCYTDPTTGEYMCHCCCQNACPYCYGAGGESQIVPYGTTLPDSCGDGDEILTCGTAPTTGDTCYFERAGWCGNSVDDCSFQSTAHVCWDHCYDLYGEALVSIDIDEFNTDNQCYTDATTGEYLCPCCCQTSCDYCNGAGGESMVVASGTTLPASCGTGDDILVCP